MRGSRKGESDFMTPEERYAQAYAYAERKHRGQKRIGGDPYISHPEAVAEMMRKKGYGMDYCITGLFHDLLEDTDAREEEIRAIGGDQVLEAVRLLTKKKGGRMEDYIAGIRKNKMAFAVKGADCLHNLRSAVVTDENFKRNYIRESREWYLDFAPEIREAVEALEATLPDKGESDGSSRLKEEKRRTDRHAEGEEGKWAEHSG